MASIATTVAVAVIFVFLAHSVFRAAARGLPKDRDHEVEVRLLFVTIRRKVGGKRPDELGPPDEREPGTKASRDGTAT